MKGLGCFVVGAMAAFLDHLKLQPGMLLLQPFSDQKRDKAILATPQQQ